MDLHKDFIDMMREMYPEGADKIVEAINNPPQTSVRLHPVKSNWLTHNDVGVPSLSDKVPWCKDGFYIEQRPLFTVDPLFHAGVYYVQEASSMFISQVFNKYVYQHAPICLDLCASPGGKSTLIANELNGRGFLLSNEPLRQRAKILSENITKNGHINTAVSSVYPNVIGSSLNEFFDVVFVDAPCSGEGMFRKDEQALADWSVNTVKMCAQRQKDILRDIWPSLAVDGILVYSTCTYNKYEDEENVQFLIDEYNADLLDIDIPSDWGITDSGRGYHFFPHKVKGEGFFAAVLRKTENISDEAYNNDNKKKKDKKQTKFVLPSEVKKWIKGDIVVDDNIQAFPAECEHIVKTISEHIPLLQVGTKLGTIKGKDVIPDHSLAMSVSLDRNLFLTEDIDRERAVSYLRCESIELSSQTKGRTLLTYRGVPIGFANNVGGRANNMYPKQWRIMMQDDPSRYVRII